MKKPNVLITPTLLNSFEFAMNAPFSWKERAMNDFVGKLRREKGTFPLWIKKGIDFEDAVYAECSRAFTMQQKEITSGSSHFQYVANRCFGGTFQSVFKKEILIDDQPILVYSKTDVVFPDKIIDIKTTLNWKGEEKYRKGWQHLVYMWASGKKGFEYLVAVWESETSNTIKELHSVDCGVDEESFLALEHKIVDGIKTMFEFLHAEGLYDDYYFTFSNNAKIR